MAKDHGDRQSRRTILKHVMGAAIVAATSGSFARKAAAQERGQTAKLAIKGGGTLLLTFEGKDRWRAVVEARGAARQPTGLLLLENGKVVGLKEGYLRLGQFGAADFGFDSNFQETVFTQFTQSGAMQGRDILVANAVLPRQIEDLRNMRAISVTPRVKLGAEQLRMLGK